MAAFEKHISLSTGTASGLYGASTTSATYVGMTRTAYALIDTTQYSGGAYYYEAVIKTSTATGYATLWDNTAAAAVSGGAVTTTSTTNVRLRSAALTLTTGNTFTDRIKNDGANTTTYYGGRVVVEQNVSTITNTESQILIYGYDNSTTTSATYIDFGTIGNNYFLYTAANWDGTVAIYYEATLKTSAATGYSQLYTFADAAVTSAEVTTTSTSLVRVRSSAITLVDATVYKGKKKNDGTNTTTVAAARLVVQQSGSPTKSESYLPAGQNDYASSAATFADTGGRAYYDPTKWSVSTITWYAEYSGNFTTGTAEMYALTDAARITGSNVATGIAVTRYRSSALTMPASAQNIVYRLDSGSGTIYSSAQQLLAVLVWANGVIYPDVAGNSGDQAAASSYSGSASWNGTNRALCIDVSMLGAGVIVTAMTYGGATCTFVGAQSTVTSFGRVESWRILSGDAGAPAVGANTLAVTLSGSLEFAVEWVSYTGVHQTSPTEGFASAQATNAGVATDASVTITTVANNDWVHAAVVANDTSITAGNTSRNNIAGTLGSGGNEDNGAPKTPAGSVTMSYTGMGLTTTWAIAGYALRDVSASTLTTNLTVNVFDSTTVAETTTPQEVNTLSVFDSTTVAETTTSTLVKTASVIDNAAIAESTTPLIPSGQANVFDSITVSENVTVLEKNLVASVIDNATVSESTTLQSVTTISLVDNNTVAEGLTIIETNLVASVFDSITITENTQPQIVNPISVVDNITVTDIVGEEEFFNINVTDSITVSESVGIFQSLFAFTANWTPVTDTSTNWEDPL